MAELRMREALRDAMAEEMRRDEAVFVMGEDVGVFQGAFKVTEGLLDEFGERRVRDTPISENTIVGAGVGAAMAGLRPVVELMTVNFSLLALDQIVNHAAAIPYMFNGRARVPLVIRMPGGGGHQLLGLGGELREVGNERIGVVGAAEGFVSGHPDGDALRDAPVDDLGAGHVASAHRRLGYFGRTTLAK